MGYTSQTAGIILIASPVVQAAFSPIMGKLSDQRSPQIISAFGMVLCSISLFFYGFLTEVTPLWLILVALAVTGVGFAMFSSPNTNAVMTSTKRRDYGVASSVLATMRSIGHTSSMAVVTIVVGLYMGAESLTNAPVPRLFQTMHTCFFLFGGLCILGFFIALKRKV